MPPQHMMGKKSLSRLLLYKKKTAGSTRPLDGYFCNRYGYSGFSTECSSLFSQHLTTGTTSQWEQLFFVYYLVLCLFLNILPRKLLG
uniref:Uncharacterized protein n=1 Tax=Aegilops tauschii subsp. strangulata TaxID=200361 RepID=A0A453RA20_AEGTS